MDLSVLLAIAIGEVVLLGLFLGLRARRKATPSKVDNYAISVVEHDGFHLVQLNVQTERGDVASYEFEPPYVHTLSDELLTACARALRESHAAAR